MQQSEQWRWLSTDLQPTPYPLMSLLLECGLLTGVCLRKFQEDTSCVSPLMMHFQVLCQRDIKA